MSEKVGLTRKGWRKIEDGCSLLSKPFIYNIFFFFKLLLMLEIVIIGPPSLSYKGSYKITLVCLSVTQFRIFLRNELLVFSNVLRDSRQLKSLKTKYFLKIPKLAQREPKIAPKWVFWVFMKIFVLAFPENNLNRKILFLFTFHH